MKFILSLLLLASLAARGGTVDTVAIYSNAMHKSSQCVVIRPSDTKGHYPVVYLLHGYSGKYSDWIRKVPSLAGYADLYHIIIVCPDGAYSSWYLDSPVDSSMRYETYVSTEVPGYIDAHYPTLPERGKRAITGLSMGGHGGLWLGFRHADRFGACGSMSGGVDLNASRGQFDIDKRVGDTVHHADNWINYSVLHQVETPPAAPLAIIFDCGVDDFFYKSNKALHEKMLRLKIAHDYIERPGGHSWSYWANSIQYQLLFFSNYFNRQ